MARKSKSTNSTPESPSSGKSRRDWTGAFLADLRANGIVTTAAEVAGIDRGTAYDRYQRDAEFAAQWDDAIEASTDALEAEARRRAFEGFDETTEELKIDATDGFERLVVTKRIRKYSDGLLMFLLRGNRRKFRNDGASEINVSVGSADPEAARAAILAAGEVAAKKRKD